MLIHKMISLYKGMPLIFQCFHDQQDSTPSGTIKNRKSTEPKSHQTAETGFLPPSDGLVQNCVNQSQPFPHKTAVLYTA